MQNTLEKIIIGILAVVVVLLALMFFSQQKAIEQIRMQAAENFPETESDNHTASFNPPENLESVKTFNGEIKAIAGNILDVEATLYTPKDPEKEKNYQAMLQAGKPISMSIKDYNEVPKLVKVSLNDKTEYYQLKKENLKVGDKVFVSTDSSPYKTENLAAIKIGYSLEK